MKFEIWMGEHYSHFAHGTAHLEDGHTLPLKACIHTSTYGRDTLLVDREDRYQEMNFPVRWYVMASGIEFYCWDAEVESVLLHNDTGTDITVEGRGVLPAGESREYNRES